MQIFSFRYADIDAVTDGFLHKYLPPDCNRLLTVLNKRAMVDTYGGVYGRVEKS